MLGERYFASNARPALNPEARRHKGPRDTERSVSVFFVAVLLAHVRRIILGCRQSSSSSLTLPRLLSARRPRVREQRGLCGTP